MWMKNVTRFLKLHLGNVSLDQQIASASFSERICHVLCKYLWSIYCISGSISWTHHSLIIKSFTPSHMRSMVAGGSIKMLIVTLSFWINSVFSQARAWNSVMHPGKWFVIHYMYKALTEIKEAHMDFGLNPSTSLCCFSLDNHSCMWFTGEYGEDQGPGNSSTLITNSPGENLQNHSIVSSAVTLGWSLSSPPSTLGLSTHCLCKRLIDGKGYASH